MTRIGFAIIIALALVGGMLSSVAMVVTSAQEDCPQDRVCVDYGTQTFQIDPVDGFLQAVIVEERTLTITDFDGTRTESQVKVATFVQSGDTYKLEREDIVPQDGIFKNADLGDTFVLIEAH